MTEIAKLAFRSPEILAPARMPVAEGKKMENMPKKLPSGPRQLGTKFSAKISAGRHKGKHTVRHMNSHMSSVERMHMIQVMPHSDLCS